MFSVTMVLFFSFLNFYFIYLFIYFGSKQQDITLLSQHFIIIQSDRVFCPLTKLMDTIEHMNEQQQPRKDSDKTVRMHRLILTFAIRIQ